MVTATISAGADTNLPTFLTCWAEHPHIRYFSDRRGFVRVRLSPAKLCADLRVIPFVWRAGAQVRTSASFVIPDRLATPTKRVEA